MAKRTEYVRHTAAPNRDDLWRIGAPGPLRGAVSVWHNVCRRTRVPAALLSLAALAAVTAHSADARGCSGIYAYDIPGTYVTLPANGGVVAYYRCRIGSQTCGAPESLTVLKAGQSVPGTVTQQGEEYVFVPTDALEVGAEYEVVGFGTFTAVEALPVDLSAVKVTVKLNSGYVRETVETLCCPEVVDSCGSPYCLDVIAPEETFAVSLGAAMDAAAPQASASALRFTWRTSSGERGATDFAALAQFVDMESKSEQYCVTPELKSLIDGSVQELDETCLAHGDLPAPGTPRAVTVSLSPDELAVCPHPMGDFADEWCEGSVARCAWDPSRCETMAEICGGGGAGGDSAGAGVGVGGGGADVADAGAAGADSEADSEAENDEGRGSSSRGGCSVSVAGGVAPSGLVLLGLLALLRRPSSGGRRRAP